MKISLRPWDMDDAHCLERVCRSVERRYLDYLPDPYNLTDAQFYITNALRREGKTGIYRAILCGGEVAGSLSVELCSDVRCKDSNLGYMVMPEYCGMGVATAAVRLAAKEAFASFGIYRITAEVAELNVPSRAVLKNCGFLLEGVKNGGFYKDGRACSLCIYGLCRKGRQ